MVLCTIIWYMFGGFVFAGLIFLAGKILSKISITAQIGHGLIQFSKFLFTPFHLAMISKKDLDENYKSSLIARIIYFPFGLFFTFMLAFYMIMFCTLVIGIPLSIILAKSLSTAFNPTDKICVSIAVRNELLEQKTGESIRKAKEELSELKKQILSGNF